MKTIRDRLSNWARWSRGAHRMDGRSNTAFICDRMRAARQGELPSAPGTGDRLDVDDADLVERAWKGLLPKHRELLRWHYIRPEHESIAAMCKNADLPHGTGRGAVLLWQLLHIARSRPMLKSTLICATLVLLAGCGTTLTGAAEKVQIVTASQKEKCKSVKLVTFNQRLGPDKPGNAMKAALNEAAAVGGNAFYVVSTSSDWAEGASVVGEALRCGR